MQFSVGWAWVKKMRSDSGWVCVKTIIQDYQLGYNFALIWSKVGHFGIQVGFRSRQVKK